MPPEDEDQITTSGVAMPDDLQGLNDAGLKALKEKVNKAFVRLNDKERVTAEDLAEMNALAEQKDTIKGEETRRGEAQVEAQAQREALAARMSDEPEAPAADEPAAPVDAPAVEEVVTPAEPEAPAADEPEAVIPETIAASAAPVRTVAEASAPSIEKWGSALSIVASSDIPGTPTGKALARDELSEALHARARGMTDTKGTSKGALVASIGMVKPKWDITDIRDEQKLREIWNEAHDVQSMVASGGWCAPSETIYDFVCDFEAVDGLVDIPTITARRGGVRVPTSPLLKDVFADADAGFTWTEQNDIDAATPGGPTKPCFVIPCPDFTDHRLQAQGLCVTAGNLTDRAYPELTNRYIDLVMAAHAHRINGLTIAKMVAGSTAFPITVYPNSGASAVLGGLEFVIQSMRDEFFMAETQVLEVKLPRWIRGLIRQDISRRSGVAYELVSNADIATWFTEIGASVQFVMDWQTLTGAQTSWPTHVTAMVFPAGSHTRLDGGSIDLGVVRDSTLNSTNDYTAAWSEEFWQVITRCASVTVDIPVCASGVTTAPDDHTCPVA